jgi:hypothetical protein
MRLPHHVQQEQVQDAVGGAVSNKKVETVVEADDEFVLILILISGRSPNHGGTRPGAVHSFEVVHKHGNCTDKATGLAGTVAWPVRTRLVMAVLVVVGSPGGTAVGGIRAREADGLHQALHGMAPSVTTGDDAADMALASGLELVTAHQTRNMTQFALHGGTHAISMRIKTRFMKRTIIYACMYCSEIRTSKR